MKDWKEEFDKLVPWHDGIKGNYVYVQDLEPFISSLLSQTRKETLEEVREKIKDFMANIKIDDKAHIRGTCSFPIVSMCVAAEHEVKNYLYSMLDLLDKQENNEK